MKSSLIKIAVFFLLAYLFIRFLPSIPVASTVTQKDDLFTVSGEGKVTVIPDTAIVDLGITTNRPSVKAAQTEANTVINNVTQAVKDLGVDSKDIKTSNYSIYPQYDYREGVNRITGYQVNASLTITVRNIDNVNSIIDAATSRGANNVGGIQLTVDESKQKELLKQAREMAVNEAKEKAQGLAGAAGITLGRIVNVQESSPVSAPKPFLARTAEGLGGAADTQIQPGSTDIVTSVVLSYETR